MLLDAPKEVLSPTYTQETDFFPGYVRERFGENSGSPCKFFVFLYNSFALFSRIPDEWLQENSFFHPEAYDHQTSLVLTQSPA